MRALRADGEPTRLGCALGTAAVFIFLLLILAANAAIGDFYPWH